MRQEGLGMQPNRAQKIRIKGWIASNSEEHKSAFKARYRSRTSTYNAVSAAKSMSNGSACKSANVEAC